MTNKIARWGNSLALRIPRTVAASLNLRRGTSVSIEKRGGALVIKPARQRRSLEEMCKGLSPKKTGGEVDMGGPVGREVW